MLDIIHYIATIIIVITVIIISVTPSKQHVRILLNTNALPYTAVSYQIESIKSSK